MPAWLRRPGPLSGRAGPLMGGAAR